MDSDKQFWIDTYNRNIKKLIGVCYRYVYDRNVAEDIAHDSFLTAMKKSYAFKGTGHFDAWLRKITVNNSLNYLRELKKTQANQKELLYNELNNKNEIMFQNYDFTTKELLDVIKELPEHHSQVFNLYVLDGFSHKQISEELNGSYNHQLRTKLAKIFGLALTLAIQCGLGRSRVRRNCGYTLLCVVFFIKSIYFSNPFFRVIF